jgi:hypothetical protein
VLVFADLADATFVTLPAALLNSASSITLVTPFHSPRHTAVAVASLDEANNALDAPLLPHTSLLCCRLLPLLPTPGGGGPP